MMKDHTHLFQRALIRTLKGGITAWEKWLDAEYLAGLPVGTPADVMDILTQSKKSQPPNGPPNQRVSKAGDVTPPRTHVSREPHHPRE